MLKKRLLIGIPTKDRPLEICMLLTSLISQTYTEFDILIINDSFTDCLNNSTFQGLCNTLKEYGHTVTILEGLRLGPHIAGQKILENSEGYEFVFRPDDDICCCEIPYLENLMTMIESDPGIGAVGGIYLVPHKSIQEQSFPDNISLEEKEKIAQIRWEGKDLYVNGILQNLIHTNLTPIQAHHLYSGFLYRREALESISGYFLDFSKVGHREETDTSYRMWLAGWKLYIVPASIAWHYHPWKGGIRETNGVMHTEDNWKHDEEIFVERMKDLVPQKYRINQTITTKDTFSVIINSENAFFAERVLSSVINSTNSNYKIAIAYPRQQEKSFNDMLEIFANRTSSNGLTEIIPYVKESSHESIFNFILNDMKESDYYCFLDESAVILGFAQDGKDWLQFMHSDFNLRSNIGAISPLSSWSDELQCQTLDFCCMFTSKKVLGVVGKFDYSLGSSKLIDWSYRCIAAGFDLKEIESGEFPFYYVPEGPSNIVTRELLSKYDVNKVRDMYRTVYPFTPEQNSIKGTKLNLGCYYMYIPGFVNVDIKEEVGADLVCDLMDIKKHYKNNTVSLILISQCLEHFSLQDGRDLIGYLHDILVPGGHLIIEVPDGDDIDGKFHRGEIDKGLYDVIKNGTPHEKHQDHKAVYTETELMRVLKFYGFKSICRRPIHMTSNQMEAIRIDCIK